MNTSLDVKKGLKELKEVVDVITFYRTTLKKRK